MPALSQLNRSAAPQTECRLVEADMSANFQGLSATVYVCVCVCVCIPSSASMLSLCDTWKMKNAVSGHSVERRLPVSLVSDQFNMHHHCRPATFVCLCSEVIKQHQHTYLFLFICLLSSLIYNCLFSLALTTITFVLEFKF